MEADNNEVAKPWCAGGVKQIEQTSTLAAPAIS
jgi:hypothetical protein